MVGLLLAMLCTHPARAFEVVNLDIEYKQVAGGSRQPELAPGRMANAELNLNLDLQLLGSLYMQNQVHSLICGRFCLIGWKFELGVFITPWLQIYTSHFSQHALDTGYEAGTSFPVYDAVGVRVRLL